MGQRNKGSGATSKRRAETGETLDISALSPVISGLATLFDSLPNLIAYVDKNHTFRYANEAYCKRIGLKPSDVIGRHISEVIGSDAYETILPEVNRVLAGEPLSYQTFVRYKEGDQRFMRVTYTPDISDPHEIRGYYAFIVDATDQHFTEEALKASEERYRAFISQSSEGIWRFELEEPMPTDLPVDEQIRWAYKYGYLAECNDAMARQYGIEFAAEIIGARLGDFLIEDDPNNVEFLRAFFTSGYRLIDAESHERDVHGNERYFINNFVGFIENGKLKRAWGTQRDITETKFADQATARLAAIVESSDDAIIGLDLEGNVKSWNEAARRIYGYTTEELLGKSIFILVPEERRRDEEKVFAHLVKGEGVDHYETVRQRKDGGLFDVSLTISPIRDPSGKIVGVSKIARDISERKTTERILNENRMMLAMAMQSSRMGVWERDIATGALSWSEELEAIFGLKKGEFRGNEEHSYSLIHEDDRVPVWNEVERAIIEKRPYTTEFRFYRADGSVRWMEGRGEAVYSAQGDPVRLYGIGIDITSRKLAEQQLKRQALLLEAALEPVIVWEFGGKILDWNRGAERLYGYGAAEAIGRDSTELLKTKFSVEFSKIEKALRQTGSWVGEVRHIAKSGEEIIVESRHQLVEVDGKPLVLEANRDITERRRVSEELQRSEARLQAMFDSATVGFAVLDTSARFLQLNDAFCQITGYSREEMLAMDCAALIHPDDVGKMTASVEQLLAGIKPHFTLEKRFVRKDGSFVWVQNSVSLIRDSEDAPLHLIAISQDITARKIAEEELLLVSRMPAENPHPVIRLSSDSKVLYANQAAASMLEAWSQSGENIPPKLTTAVREAFANGKKREIEIQYGGQTVSCTVAPISEAGYVNVYGTDITARKQMEEALRESEQRFSRFMQQLPGLAWIKDMNGRYVYANDAAEKSFGIAKADLYGKSDEEVFPAESAKQFKEHDRRAVESGSGIQVLESLIEEDGIRHYSIVSKFPISGPEGKTALIGGMAIDVTDQKQAEDELRRRMEFDEAVMSNMGEGLCTVDAQGRVTSMNPAAEKLLGWTFEELNGQRMHDAVHYKHRDGSSYPVEECPIMRVTREDRALVNQEDVFIRKDGTFFDVLFSSSPIRANGETAGLVVVFQDISERKRADEALARYRHLSEYASDIIWMVRTGGEIVEVNQAAVDAYGYSREELLGMNVRQLRDPSTLDLLEEQIDEAIAGSVNFETIHRRKDGTSFPVEVNASSAEFGGERLIMSIVRDITERKRQEKNHQFLFGLSDLIRTETSPENIFSTVVRRLGKHLDVSRCFISTVDLENETSTVISEFRHDDLEPLVSVASLRDYSPATRKTAEAGRTIVVADTAHDSRTADKYAVGYSRVKVVSYVAVPLTHDGRWTGTFFVSRVDPYEWSEWEVSLIQTVAERVWLAAEKLRSDTALRESEKRAIEEYQGLLERIVPLAETLGGARELVSIYRALHEFICASMDCSGFFVSFYDSIRHERLAAYVWGEGDEIDIATLPPMPITQGGGPNSQAIFGKRTVITNRYWTQQQNRPHLVLKENGIDPMSSIVVPMVVQDRVIGTLEVQAHREGAFQREDAIALEMAGNLAAVAIENVRLIEIEAKARTEAESANKMKDEFLSVLSHELRTPLNAMLGWVRILRSGSVDEGRIEKALEIIERNTRQQSSLIEDLLDVSRIISGKMRIDHELIDLSQSLDLAVESVRPMAAGKGIDFCVETAPEPLYLKGDAVRLQQVFTNLLQNAIKFSESGGKVSLELEKSESEVSIKVIDIGSGIDPTFLPYIFDRFSQADASTRRNHAGLGLGLTIVRTIVELHGGTIAASSEGTGKGATFAVRLPLAEEFYRPESIAAPVIIANGHSNVLSGVKILVVDDDVDGLVPLRIMLEREDASVASAVSAREALEQLETKDFDILISDIGMPSMDGFELIASVRQNRTHRNRNIKAIAYTAYASEEDRNRVLSAGYHVHLAKPLDFDELLAIVKNFSHGIRRTQ